MSDLGKCSWEGCNHPAQCIDVSGHAACYDCASQVEWVCSLPWHEEPRWLRWFKWGLLGGIVDNIID